MTVTTSICSVPAFYITQAVSITFDILFVLWVRRLAGISAEGDGLAGRLAVATAAFIGSWFFLYMYETKGGAAPEHRYAVQLAPRRGGIHPGDAVFLLSCDCPWRFAAPFPGSAAADRRG